MISVILIKMSKYTNLHLSFFQNSGGMTGFYSWHLKEGGALIRNRARIFFLDTTEC